MSNNDFKANCPRAEKLLYETGEIQHIYYGSSNKLLGGYCDGGHNQGSWDWLDEVCSIAVADRNSDNQKVC